MEQEQLIVSNERTQQYAVRDFSEDGPAVNLLERNIRLQNVLDLLKEKQRLENYRWVLSRDTDLVDEVRDARVESTSASIKNVTKHTKEQFAHAAGMYTLIDSGVDERVARQITRKAFSDFRRKGAGIRDEKKAKKLRTKLEDTYPLIEATTPIDIPMHEAEEPTEESAGAKALSRERRAVREDIMRIQSDDRAGFLPTTNQEKNRILPWLDYIDTEKYPRGIWNQLEEVFTHQQKTGHGIEGGFEAVKSITYETEDYLANAVHSTKALKDLQVQIEELPHYRYSLTEEFGETHPAYNVLARFADIRAIIREHPAADADVLTTKTTRWERSGPGKHKKIEDNYTAEELDPLYAERVTRFAEETRVKDARQLLRSALDSEQRRVAFYSSRLQDIVDKAPHSRRLADIRRIAQDALDAYTSNDEKHLE